MTRRTIHRLTGLLPLLLSLAALLLLIGALALRWAPEPDGDEGAPAHIFQLLIVAQLPLILAFLATAEGNDWRRTGKWLAAQLAAIVLALAPVFYFGL